MRNAKRSVLIGISGLTLIGMFAAAFFFYGHTQAAGTTRFLAAAGTGGFKAPSVNSNLNVGAFETLPGADFDQPFNTGGSSTQQNPPTVAPNPSPNGVSNHNVGETGFPGVDHFDSRTASNGNQFSLEPPDQGLCAGGNFVIDTVNDVVAVYNATTHKMVNGPTALNAFFGLPPSITRSNPPVFGTEATDPKCYFDSATGHWIMTMLGLDLDPVTEAFTGHTREYIAVTQTTTPTGKWSIFTIDTTDDGSNGTPVHAGCPCLGDQPLIGADQYGFYITTNEFPIFANGFNGAQVYAMSKDQLIKAAEHAGSTPSFIQINVGTQATPDQGGIWYSIQPATSPRLGHEPNNGTEYFLSALDFFGTLDNRVAVWALTNTRDLGTSHADQVTLTHTVIGSETYGQPPVATQKAGSTPLGLALGDSSLMTLNSNDDRMNQVVYADGLLWSGVNTVVQRKTGPALSAVTYFVVRPDFDHNHLKAFMVNQGYISLANDNVLFPSIGVNDDGDAVMSFSVSGPDYYPSAGYVTLHEFGHAGKVHISGAGVGPEDGFTGYPEEGGNGTSRWGDYSAAVAGSNGTIWLAAEWIGQTCTEAEFLSDNTCGGTRTILANWGTFLTNVRVFGD